MKLETRKLNDGFGVEILGAHLRHDVSDALFDAILENYYVHSVLLFRDQDLPAQAQAALTRRFGTAKQASKMRYALDRAPEISRLGNVRADGKPVAFYNRQGVEWHADGAGEPDKDRATFLYAVEVPTKGGDTMFCNMHVAFDTLPNDVKERIGGRQVLHSFLQHNDRVLAFSPGAFPPMSPEDRARFPDMWEDLVQFHPVTGRALYYISINLVKAISGLSSAEAERLTEFLVDHATAPGRVYRHRWRVGDLMIWDNRATMHSPTDPGEYEQSRRLMHRSSAFTHPEQWLKRARA